MRTIKKSWLLKFPCELVIEINYSVVLLLSSIRTLVALIFCVRCAFEFVGIFSRALVELGSKPTNQREWLHNHHHLIFM